MTEKPMLQRDAIEFVAAFTVGAVLAAWITIWVRRMHRD